MSLYFKDKCECSISKYLESLSEEELEGILDLPDTDVDEEDLRDIMRWLGKHDVGSLV